MPQSNRPVVFFLLSCVVWCVLMSQSNRLLLLFVASNLDFSFFNIIGKFCLVCFKKNQGSFPTPSPAPPSPRTAFRWFVARGTNPQRNRPEPRLTPRAATARLTGSTGLAHNPSPHAIPALERRTVRPEGEAREKER